MEFDVLTMTNFIALGQTVYEKSVLQTIFCIVHYFGAPDSFGQSSSIWVVMYSKPLHQAAKFRLILKTRL